LERAVSFLEAQMIDQKILLIAAAVAVVFLPQILAFMKDKLHFAPVSAVQVGQVSAVQSRSVGSNPSDWLNDLYALRSVLLSNDQKEAADLLSQAMTKIIGADLKGGLKK
jgi:hypothetical protein